MKKLQKPISPLRFQRIIRGLTLYDVMEATGIQAVKLSLIERGYKEPRHEELLKLAEVFGCQIGELTE